MITLADLWLPIVLSAAAVFVVSSLVHMALQLHKKDYAKLPDEEALLAALRSAGVQEGQYVFPCAMSMKEMGSPEMVAKQVRGPNGWMIVRAPGAANMGKALGQWFAYCLVVGLLTAYIASLALTRGADAGFVVRITATASFMGYGLYAACDSIWKGARWSASAKYWIDALLYAAATSATFAWLWPEAAGG